MNSPEFDQAVHAGKRAIMQERQFHMAPVDEHAAEDDARAVLLAVLQPEPCPRCGGEKVVFNVGNAADPGEDVPCRLCGGSGVSNVPPVLFRAMSEQHGWPDDGQHWRDCWHYVPPSTRSTT